MCVKINEPTILFNSASYICNYFRGEMATIVTVIKDEIFREGLTYLLNNSEGCRCVASFSDYESVAAFFVYNLCDIVLFDIDISFENAVNMITELKSQRKGLIIIALSYEDDYEKVYKSIIAGADGFLIKNISHTELIESIREACKGGAPLSSSAAKKLVDFFRRNGHTYSINKNYDLSPREKEVVSKLVDGKTMREVARELFISIDTVRFHSKNIYRKLKVRNQAELVAKTLREKLI
jgi:DNA-binding NarL/FixJ family response regulator